MIKTKIIILLLFTKNIILLEQEEKIIKEDKEPFDADAAICLLNIIFESSFVLPNTKDDTYLKKIRKMIKKKDKIAMSDFHNVSILASINYLMINYDFLNQKLKDEIRACNLNIEQTFLRCNNIYGKDNCHKSNDYTYAPGCPPGYILYNNYICYKKCPRNFIEFNNKCKKPENYILKMYSTKDECESTVAEVDKDNNFLKEEITENIFENINQYFKNERESIDHHIIKPCKEYMNGTFFTKNCRNNFKTRFLLYCLAVCPDGLIANGEYCFKRFNIPLPSPVVFNFNDLFE